MYSLYHADPDLLPESPYAEAHSLQTQIHDLTKESDRLRSQLQQVQDEIEESGAR